MEQKKLANVNHVTANADVAKEKLAHAKKNAHVAAIVENNKKADNQYPERYQSSTFKETIGNHRYNSSFSK